MSSSSNDTERKEAADVAEEAMPLPVDAKIILLGGIFFILFLAALYVVADIVWPLVLAFVLSLLLKPPMRLLARLRIPRVLCAALLVVAVLGLVVGLGTAISGPAASWAAKLPRRLASTFPTPQVSRSALRHVAAHLATDREFRGMAGKCKLISGRHHSDKAVHWHSQLRQRLFYDASVLVFPAYCRRHFSPEAGRNYAAL